MTPKEHYQNHLAEFYSWMCGDFETRQLEFHQLMRSLAIVPHHSKKAIDLGAGHGIQSVALARLGYDVRAVDFNEQLLDELERNATGLSVKIIHDDIKNIRRFSDQKPALIVCCGDTLTHLGDKDEIKTLINDCAETLVKDGQLLLSFRDYSIALTGNDRFIYVKGDETRILTCVLDYEKERVRVTDLLCEKTGNGWEQRVSSYYKVRISTAEIITFIEAAGMSVERCEVIGRMITVLAIK